MMSRDRGPTVQLPHGSGPASSASNAPATISRREAIRRAAMLVGVAISPSWLAAVDRVRAAAQSSYLTTAQLTLTRAVADRIIPRTDTPGASDVGVPAFIDRLYGEFMTADEQSLFVEGLDLIRRTAISVDPAGFEALAADRQDALLRDLADREQAAEEAAGPGSPQSAFRQIRTSVILGYFTSEEVGRNVLHYDPIPGRYDACIPIQEVGNRNWTT